MKKTSAWIALLLLLCLLPLPVLGEDADALPITFEWHWITADGEALSSEIDESGDSYVRYPEFFTDDEALLPAIQSINDAIQEKARIPEYVQLLSTVMPGSVGLRMQCSLSITGIREEDAEEFFIQDRYVSLLFSAEGKMLSGRPSQVYYPMTFDLLTGEEVTFDQLFSDPEGAKAFIEEYLEEKVEPTLSTYLENSEIFPVPYDRFWLDDFGHLILYWENGQLSFLSGYSGAVSFRRSELAPYLDLTENGVIPHLMYDRYIVSKTPEEQAENLWSLLGGGVLIAGSPTVNVGMSDLETYAGILHFTTDSGYYPGGAYLEAEEPILRGALILTDENEDRIIGILSGNTDVFAIHTGETTLSDAVSFLGREPDITIEMNEDAAEIYCVCPGTAAVYHVEPQPDGSAYEFTLYADSDGIVQFVRLMIENE